MKTCCMQERDGVYDIRFAAMMQRGEDHMSAWELAMRNQAYRCRCVVSVPILCQAVMAVLVICVCAGCSSLPESHQDSSMSLAPGAVPGPDNVAVMSVVEKRATAEEEQKAIEVAERAAGEARRKQAEVYADSGRRFRAMGDLEKALQNFKNALQVDPEFYAVDYEAAEVLSKQNRPAEALRRLRTMLTRMLDDPPDRIERRVRSKAEHLIKRLDTVNEGLSEAAEVLVKNAKVAEEEDRAEDAETLYRKAFDLCPTSSDARDWLRQRNLALASSSVDGGNTNASISGTFLELDELRAVSSYCNRKDEIRINETRWGGLPMYNGGRVLNRGIWAPAPSRLAYHLAGRFHRLTATVAVSAFKGEKAQIEAIEREMQKKEYGTVRFVVYGDGKVLYDSGIVNYAAGLKQVDVNLDGVQELVLEASDAGDGDVLDYAVWADGKLGM